MTRTIHPQPPPRPILARLMGWLVVPAVLAAIVLVQTNSIQQATCETFDEFTFLRLGMDVYRLGDVHGFASPMDPALPVWLEYTWAALSAHALPDTPGWAAEVPALIRRARFQTSLVVGVPLVWLVYSWLARRRGWCAGAFGGVVLALSPTIVAAAAIATTDACAGLFALVALASLVHDRSRPSWRSLVLLGVGLGLGLAAKQSAVFLVLVTAIELLVASWPHRGDGSRRQQALTVTRWVVGRLGVVAVIGFLTDWATFGFGLGPRFRSGQGHVDLPILVPMLTALLPASMGEPLLEWIKGLGVPLPIETFLGLVHKARLGHSGYLMGRSPTAGSGCSFPSPSRSRAPPWSSCSSRPHSGAGWIGRPGPTRPGGSG